MAKKGIWVAFDNSTWKVSKGSMVVAKGSLIGTLYLFINIFNYSMNLVSIGEDAILRHNRLGHTSDKGMKILHSKCLLPNLKELDMGFCEERVYGKQRRVSFIKVGKEKKSEKLDLVQTNVWGPTQVKSLDVSSYFVTLIDESTRKTWFYYNKQKLDVFETF